jgi:hypothetical protein
MSKDGVTVADRWPKPPPQAARPRAVPEGDVRRAPVFVLMPFGRKPSGKRRTLGFDHVHSDTIAPAVSVT